MGFLLLLKQPMKGTLAKRCWPWRSSLVVGYFFFHFTSALYTWHLVLLSGLLAAQANRDAIQIAARRKDTEDLVALDNKILKRLDSHDVSISRLTVSVTELMARFSATQEETNMESFERLCLQLFGPKGKDAILLLACLYFCYMFSVLLHFYSIVLCFFYLFSAAFWSANGFSGDKWQSKVSC